MPLTPAGRISGWRRVLILVIMSVLLGGATGTSWATPSSDPISTPTPTPTGEQPAAGSSPSPTAPEPGDGTSIVSGSPDPSHSAEPSTKPDDGSAGPEPAPTPTPTPSTTPPAAKKGVVNAQVVPPASEKDAVITVKVGGVRTSPNAVGALPKVELALYAKADETTPIDDSWARCASDEDGDCSFVVPDTQSGGANRDARYWIKQTAAPERYSPNPDLGVGTDTSLLPYRFQTPEQLRGGSTYRSTSDFMIDTGARNDEASGGIWQSSLSNPRSPTTCGISVALVLDLSSSVTSEDLVELKSAANAYVDALAGTPSRLAGFTFATTAPAAGERSASLGLTSVSTEDSAAVVRKWIDGLTTTDGADGGRNWDRGLYQVARSTTAFDLAVMITEGSPTSYGPGSGPGDRTRFREIESAVFSANAVKVEGSRTIAFGVGKLTDNEGGAANLAAVTGSEEGADFYRVGTYSAVGEILRKLTATACNGSVTVVKQLVPAETPADSVEGATPAGGWEFTGTGTERATPEEPTVRTTTWPTGAATFPIRFPDGSDGGPITLIETPQDGYTLQPVDGANAVCRRTDNGEQLKVGNEKTGFTVEASSGYPITCTVYNRAPKGAATVTLDKTWVVDGTAYREGQQPEALSAAGIINETTQPWLVPRTGFTAGDTVVLDERLGELPTQCRVEASLITTVNGKDTKIELPTKVEVAAGANTYGITNAVTCRTQLTLAKTVQSGPADPREWKLTAVTPRDALPGPSGVTGSEEATAPVTPGVTYPLAEAGGDLRYVQLTSARAELIPESTGSWTCQELDQDGKSVIPGFADGLNGGVTVPFGTWVRCTAVNETSSLRLVKSVVNDNGGTAAASDWELRASPSGTFPDGLPVITQTGADEGDAVVVPVRPDVTYDLDETGPSGYSPTSLSCLVDGDPILASAVTLRAGQEAVCTYVNDDQPATLTLDKTVLNGATGAVAVSADWTLNADGPTPITGRGESAAVTNQTVDAGSYTLSETDGPDGYLPSAWSCTGAISTGAVVVVPNGGAVTCTITNTAEQPTLTLIKTVRNDNGGSALREDWTLSAAGPTAGVTGVTGSATVTRVPVAVGSYTLTESGGPTGYAAGDWSCVGGTQNGTSVAVVLGDDVTCTVTNDDQPAQLTLVKTVADPDGSGTTYAPADWTLTATPQDIDGQDDVSGTGDPTSPGGVRARSVSAGAYELSEDGPTGFDGSLWECTGGAVVGAVVTIPNGGDVTCSITNTAIAPRLTLVKTVDNDDGGTAVASDWTLSADGPSPISGVTGAPAVTDAAVAIGTYTLDEAGPRGYTPSGWSCLDSTGAPFPVDDASIAVSEGDDVTCTITNDDVLGTWTLAKSSDPVSGTAVQPGDEITYTLTALNDSAGIVAGAMATDDLADVLDDATLSTVGSGGAVTGTTLSWTIPDLAPGDRATLTYTVVVAADAYGASLRNVVTPGRGGSCRRIPVGRPDAARAAAPLGAQATADCTTTHLTPGWSPETSSDPDSDSENLPNTGGPSPLPLALGAGFALAGVLALAESRRRRNR